MKDRLEKEEVLHVAKLAKIQVREEDISKYQVELKQLLNDVEKINKIQGYDDEILISPTKDECRLREDVEEEMLKPEEVLKNVPHHNGNYIEVPVVINE